MGMRITCKNIEVSEESATQPALRKHSSYCLLNHRFRLFGQQILRRLKTLSARITCMAYILLLGHFIAGKLHFFSIDYNHIVAAIHMRSETWLMFSPQD